MNLARIETPITLERIDEIGDYAWPGGYAIYYLDCNAGDILCPACAREEIAAWIADVAEYKADTDWQDGDPLPTAPELAVECAADNDDAYNGTGIQCENGHWIVEHDPEEYAQNFDAYGNDIRSYVAPLPRIDTMPGTASRGAG